MTMDGLEGVVVAETCLSDVDGERGRLVIRGHDVEALAERADFEGVCALLWTGELALTTDLRRVSADDANRAERRVLPLTLALLVVAFGGLAAAA